ncbi:hypothetical protein MMC20_006714 [Loxospora ochrophaea]|nr:hypothetical protein [Loxospora ochrophaea]
MDTLLTAEVAANSPRFRRKSSTFVDAIHDLPERGEMAPAQLYSTESGRLFHSGKIAIVTVGLPARGKTLGVKSRIFHLGDYRRATVGPGQDVPEDYFFVNGERFSETSNCEVEVESLDDGVWAITAVPEHESSPLSLNCTSASTVYLRQKILKKCRNDIFHFLNHENGQIAIYDAVNPMAAGRRSLAKEFAKHDVQTLFIESACNDERIIEENVRNVKISSPDYVGWSSNDAVKHYLARIAAKIPHFETMEERDLNYIKMINAGERLTSVKKAPDIRRELTLAEAGVSREEDSYKTDATLSEQGIEYSRKMGETLIQHREENRQAMINRGGPDTPLKPLTIWSSTRRRTLETSEYLSERGYKVRQRSQMSQLNPGVCEKMSESRIREEYPDEVTKHEADPYHHRYPRAEAKLEREQNDLLIIAHESVLRVLYGYLMACNATDIPSLSFPRNEIIEIIPASYNNEAKRIKIEDLAEEIIPASPEDIKIPVPPSEAITPIGLDGPRIKEPTQVS